MYSCGKNGGSASAVNDPYAQKNGTSEGVRSDTEEDYTQLCRRSEPREGENGLSLLHVYLSFRECEPTVTACKSSRRGPSRTVSEAIVKHACRTRVAAAADGQAVTLRRGLIEMVEPCQR